MIIAGASERIKYLKEQNGRVLAGILSNLGTSSFSEYDLARHWLDNNKAAGDLYDKGWYDPPPEGAIILFGKQQDGYRRISAPSFRPEPMWPQANIFYDQDDILTVYTSPVCRSTNLIGDFGLSLYRGKDSEILAHFENVLITSLEIARFARAGMCFAELYATGMAHAKARGLKNAIESRSDLTGTNIGHSIPLSYASDKSHDSLRGAANFDSVKAAISNGRKFINARETQIIERTMSFTIEPRLLTDTLPGIFYHLTVIIEDGAVFICHGFTPVFEAFGMSRFVKFLPEG